MDADLIKAHLNLYAVLQNLEDLVKLDPEMAALTRNWNVSIQFSVRNGPVAGVAFRNGVCTHSAGSLSSPSVKLYFHSPKHLNAMFDGKANPIPLKGFMRLGFLQKEFSRLTDRLGYYLKPENGRQADAQYRKVNTILTLHTAAYAVKELALLEPTSREVAAHTPPGTLQMEVLPEGPYVYLTFGPKGVEVRKGVSEKPMARMAFRNLDVAHALLNNQLDAFLAVAQGDVILQGQLPMIDNVNLILDRVASYLS